MLSAPQSTGGGHTPMNPVVAWEICTERRRLVTFFSTKFRPIKTTDNLRNPI